MRKVIVSDLVRKKLEELEYFLIDELKLSEEFALKRSRRMRVLINSLCNPADYPLCRFKKWKVLGYRCVVFERDWVFAYEVFKNGVIVRDMAHTSTLFEL